TPQGFAGLAELVLPAPSMRLLPKSCKDVPSRSTRKERGSRHFPHRCGRAHSRLLCRPPAGRAGPSLGGLYSSSMLPGTTLRRRPALETSGKSIGETVRPGPQLDEKLPGEVPKFTRLLP